MSGYIPESECNCANGYRYSSDGNYHRCYRCDAWEFLSERAAKKAAAAKARAEAERVIRAVSFWGALAAVLHRRGEADYRRVHYGTGPVVWIPSGPTPQPPWFGDKSPHVTGKP